MIIIKYFISYLNVAKRGNVGGLHIGGACLLQQLGEALEAEHLCCHVLHGGQLGRGVLGRASLNHRVLNTFKQKLCQQHFVKFIFSHVPKNWDVNFCATFPQVVCNFSPTVYKN